MNFYTSYMALLLFFKVSPADSKINLPRKKFKKTSQDQQYSAQ